MDVFDPWTLGTHVVVDHAARLARRGGLTRSSEGHLLLALCDLAAADWSPRGTISSSERAQLLQLQTEFAEAAEVLWEAGADRERVAARLRELLPAGAGRTSERHVSRSEEAQAAFAGAVRYCLENGLRRVRPVHLLPALAESRSEWVLGALRGLDPDGIAGAVRAADLRRAETSASSEARPGATVPPADVLARIGTELTASAGVSPPAVGRDCEVAELCAILHEKPAPVALLIGPDGSGRRTVAAAAARRIASGSAPARLLGRRLWEVDPERLLELDGEEWTRLREELRAGTEIVFLHPFEPVLQAQSSEPDRERRRSELLEELQGRTFPAIGTLRPESLSLLPGSLPWFVPCFVLEPTPEESVAMLGAALPKLERWLGLEADLTVCRRAVEWGARFDPANRRPENAAGLFWSAAVLAAEESPPSARLEVRHLEQAIAARKIEAQPGPSSAL